MTTNNPSSVITPSPEQMSLGEWFYNSVKPFIKTSETNWENLQNIDRLNWILMAAAMESSWKSTLTKKIKSNQIGSFKFRDEIVSVFFTNSIPWMDDCLIIEFDGDKT